MSGLAKLCGGQTHKCVLGQVPASTRRRPLWAKRLRNPYARVTFIAIPFNRIMPGLLTMIYSLWNQFLDFSFPERFTLWKRKKKSRHKLHGFIFCSSMESFCKSIYPESQMRPSLTFWPKGKLCSIHVLPFMSPSMFNAGKFCLVL